MIALLGHVMRARVRLTLHVWEVSEGPRQALQQGAVFEAEHAQVDESAHVDRDSSDGRVVEVQLLQCPHLKHCRWNTAILLIS